MTWHMSDLPWLPVAPEKIRKRCREVANRQNEAGGAIRELAGFALDINQSIHLANTIDECKKRHVDFKPLEPFRLGLLSNSTTDLLLPVLVAAAARYGLLLEVVATPFGQVMQGALDPNSEIISAQPDVVLLALDHHGLPFSFTVDRSGSDEMLEDALNTVNVVRQGVHNGCGAPVILQTVPRPLFSFFGSYDTCFPGTYRHVVEAFNRALADEVGESTDILLDVAALAEEIGLSQWHDDVQWNHAKLPFSQNFVPLYADRVARVLASIRGKSRKCLVFDLDNTLWGGVIGDDGLEGIVIGQGDPVGEAYLEVQKLGLDYKKRGIVLAVCSKNEDETARLPFQKHPDMLLKEEDFSVFQANWSDKATNLKAIAKTLNIGLDSLVFVDDNPAERALVRRFAPEVAVPVLPEDPSLFCRTINSAGYFEALEFTKDDKLRAEQYLANAKRATLSEQTPDINAYLKSLEMKISFSPFDPVGRSRIVQLINKSNQFNLTTRRYTEAQVEALDADCDVFTLQVRLADVFGDNGMISVIICRPEKNSWEIDTWLMSCRVLSRGVEKVVLDEIVFHARNAKVNSLAGRYIPTDRNAMVRDHYKGLDFKLFDESDGDSSVWSLDLSAYVTEEPPMTVVRQGFANLEKLPKI